MTARSTRILALAGAAALAAFGTAAHAGNVHWSVGINLPIAVAPAPVYVAAAPVYVAPAPVVVAPAPVYVAPAPVVIAPRPVVYARPVVVLPAPVYYRHGYHRAGYYGHRPH